MYGVCARIDRVCRLTDVDTDKVVSEVRDMLVAHSISQRLFGEHVLGLSQGSVSDLLARPKPWPMLTTKGKEPFVRMLMFMKQRDVAIQRLNGVYACHIDLRNHVHICSY
jgi:hypothetical protein